MKKIFSLLLAAACFTSAVQAQNDKSKRKSPPAEVKTTLANGGANIIIRYSRPSVNGRVIGKDLEPMEGKVWRTGANEATVFETDKDVSIQGQPLPAGKYSVFTIYNGNKATIIFNKKWEQWGAYEYNEADDQLRVAAKVIKNSPETETLTISLDKNGEAAVLWGGTRLNFKVDPATSK